MKKVLSLILTLTLICSAFLLCACAKIEVTFNEEAYAVRVNKTLDLTKEVKVTDSKEQKHEITWTSSDPSKATVANGVVTGVAVGTTEITATVGKVSAKVTVTVTEYGWDETYAIPNVTLCEHDPFDFTRTNAAQFRMHADIYLENPAENQQQAAIYGLLDSAMMLYTTANLQEVKSYIEENITSGADIDALDTANRIRHLVKGASSSKLEYLATDNPESTGFYTVGVDFITMNSISQFAGVYHFYIASVADGMVKWVEEADQTFTMTEDMISVRNALVDFVYDTSLETENADAANWTNEVKAEAIKNAIIAEIDDAIAGLTIAVAHDSDDLFAVTVTKGECTKTEKIDVLFGPPADPTAWLIKIRASHLDEITDANSYGVKVNAGPAYDASTATDVVVGYSSADLAAVKTYLSALTREQIDALYPESGTIYLRQRAITYVGGGSIALSAGSHDFINTEVDMMETAGTYYIYVGIIGENGLLWIGRLEEAIVRGEAALALNKTTLSLQVEGTETLTANKEGVTWASDNTAVATVAAGVVTGVSAGTAKITATLGSESVTVDVTVVANVDQTAWLISYELDNLDTIGDPNDLGVKATFGPAYNAETAKKMVVGYSIADLETVRAYLGAMSRDEIDALWPEEGQIYLRQRPLMTETNKGTVTFAPSSGSGDIVYHDLDLITDAGTYYIYLGVIGDDGLLWIGRCETPAYQTGWLTNLSYVEDPYEGEVVLSAGDICIQGEKGPDWDDDTFNTSAKIIICYSQSNLAAVKAVFEGKSVDDIIAMYDTNQLRDSGTLDHLTGSGRYYKVATVDICNTELAIGTDAGEYFFYVVICNADGAVCIMQVPGSYVQQ